MTPKLKEVCKDARANIITGALRTKRFSKDEHTPWSMQYPGPKTSTFPNYRILHTAYLLHFHRYCPAISIKHLVMNQISVNLKLPRKLNHLLTATAPIYSVYAKCSPDQAFIIQSNPNGKHSLQCCWQVLWPCSQSARSSPACMPIHIPGCPSGFWRPPLQGKWQKTFRCSWRFSRTLLQVGGRDDPCHAKCSFCVC